MFKFKWFLPVVAVVQLSYASDEIDDQPQHNIEETPKLESYPIRPKSLAPEADRYRIPPEQLKRLQDETEKFPRLIIPLHDRSIDRTERRVRNPSKR